MLEFTRKLSTAHNEIREIFALCIQRLTREAA